MIILKVIVQIFLCSIIHELGHAIACWLYGFEVSVIQIGIGGGINGIAHLRIKRTYLQLGPIPYGGYVLCFKDLTPLQDFIITAAGPAANALVACSWFFYTNALLQPLQVLNLFMCLYALLPIAKYKDGYRLLKILSQYFSTKKQKT